MKTLLRSLLIVALAIGGTVYVSKVYYDPQHLKAVARKVRPATSKQPLPTDSGQAHTPGK